MLWEPASTLRVVEGIRPLLASWERRDHPAQVRLHEYLSDFERALVPLPRQREMFLHMDIDVGDPRRLLHHYDLENYLTPVVAHLGAERFCMASGRKHVGGGSRLAIGSVRPAKPTAEGEGWHSFSCCAGSGVQTKNWKAGLRSALATSAPEQLPPGPAAVHVAWSCSGERRRNWAGLWKPTLDAMGPVLGEPDPRNPFNPNDDRIVQLAMHLNTDARADYSVDVEMWWRPI